MTPPPAQKNGNCRIAVVSAAADPHVQVRAARLATELALPAAAGMEATRGHHDLVLSVDGHGLAIREVGGPRGRPLYIDFVIDGAGFRLRGFQGARQLLARAVGIRKGCRRIVDATAGLGRDAFLLASLGCEVLALERSAVLGALLKDAISRARSGGNYRVRAAAERISLIVEDSRGVLRRLSGIDAPDVVYLDPMYPPGKESALSKKEIRICRKIVGDDDDAADLLDVARSVASKRVVVKRHRRTNPLADAPSVSFIGRTVRYDVYEPSTRRPAAQRG